MRKSASHESPHPTSKETPKTVDLRRLMADPNLRCPVTNAMVAVLEAIPNGTCMSYFATDMANAMLSTAAELVPRSKRPRGARGRCVDPGVEAEINASWYQRQKAKRRVR